MWKLLQLFELLLQIKSLKNGELPLIVISLEKQNFFKVLVVADQKLSFKTYHVYLWQ